MKRVSLIALAFGASLIGTSAKAEITLNALMMSQAAYSEQDVKDMTTEFEAANPGVTVDLEFVPYEALHDKIVTSAGLGDDGYDIVLFDVIWPAELAERGFLMDVTSRIPAAYTEQVFDGAWTTVEYEGHRYGMPWILDTKYLFYNTEMLAEAGFDSPPASWAELTEQATAIKNAGLVEYPLVWSWSQSEAMICDFTTLTSAFGGSFFADGQPVFQDGGALEAVNYMRASLESGLTNPASTEYFEEDVRRVFSNGDAAFAMNWTYMNGLANDPSESAVAGKVGVVSALGSDGVSEASSVNGSMGLGIPINSPHADEAWAYIQHLASPSVQESFATLSLPIWRASYENEKVTSGQEDLVAAAEKSIAVMYPRPLVASYTEVSSILQRHIHAALLGEAEPAEALQEAAKRVARIR